jgi:hypothetical protein
MQGKTDLVQVVEAFRLLGRTANLLHRGEQEGKQHADDPNHDQ